MPIKTYDTKQKFDEEYNLGAEKGHPNTRQEVKLQYHRAVLFSQAERRASQFISILNIQPTDRVLILGSGFGWTVEAMEGQGIIDVIGVDTSPYINSNISTTEEADINQAILDVGLDPTLGEGLIIKNNLWDGGVKSRTKKGIKNQDLSSVQSRNVIKQALGNKVPDIAILELLSSFTDQEILDYMISIEKFSNSIIIAHFVLTTKGSGRIDLKMKTLEDWKALIPSNTFIEVGTYRIL